MNAYFRKNMEAVSVLIQAGADLNLQEEDGWTVLMQASSSNDIETVKSLMEAGANQEVLNHQKKTAGDLAKERGHVFVADLLEAYSERQALSQAMKPMEASSSFVCSKKTDSLRSSKGLRL